MSVQRKSALEKERRESFGGNWRSSGRGKEIKLGRDNTWGQKGGERDDDNGSPIKARRHHTQRETAVATFRIMSKKCKLLG